jgi:hypothetical protein
VASRADCTTCLLNQSWKVLCMQRSATGFDLAISISIFNLFFDVQSASELLPQLQSQLTVACTPSSLMSRPWSTWTPELAAEHCASPVPCCRSDCPTADCIAACHYNCASKVNSCLFSCRWSRRLTYTSYDQSKRDSAHATCHMLSSSERYRLQLGLTHACPAVER